MPPTPFPLTTLVLNVTNQCNLSCGYCYEYSEDKIVDTENGRQPKFMSEETAQQSVDFMMGESAEIETVHLTFFGGETLMNFPVLKKTVGYARQRAEQLGKGIEFSLTTNATLLRARHYRVAHRKRDRCHRVDRRAQGDAGRASRLQGGWRYLRHHRAQGA